MFGSQLLAALKYLGEQGVVHRDIKPANIFVKGRGCVLGDFGLIKRTDQASDHKLDVEMLVETLGPAMPKAYRTPDLVEYSRSNVPLTTKTDIFQLGLVFAKLFTGSNPLRPAKELLGDLEMDEVKPVPGELGSAIRSIIIAMVQISPDGRPAVIDLLAAWNGILETACRMTQEIEGKVLP